MYFTWQHKVRTHQRGKKTTINLPRHGRPAVSRPAEPTGPVGRALINKATKRAVVTLEDLSPWQLKSIICGKEARKKKIFDRKRKIVLFACEQVCSGQSSATYKMKLFQNKIASVIKHGGGSIMLFESSTFFPVFNRDRKQCCKLMGGYIILNQLEK